MSGALNQNFDDENKKSEPKTNKRRRLENGNNNI
jgi:hypothetical protein